MNNSTAAPPTACHLASASEQRTANSGAWQCRCCCCMLQYRLLGRRQTTATADQGVVCVRVRKCCRRCPAAAVRTDCRLSDCRRAHVISLPRAPPSALRPHLPSKLLHPSLGLIFHVRSPLHSRTRLCSVWMLPAAVQLPDAAAIEQPKLYRGSVSGSVTVLVLGPAGPCPWRRARRP